ncbi:hypothetical protein LQZ19_08415 [Treponema primitia]|uniref:hypothetical protein n=1 Tax=Treponema primitia TaxID=88058 RepID=UPI00397F8740
MNNVFDESGLRFDFSSCGVADRFDIETNHGMKAVDFIVEGDTYTYFIEVKNFQHPNAPQKSREDDYRMLVEAGTAKKAIFALEMGEKIKDSLLRQYALGGKFTKKVVYILFIHLDKLAPRERGRLMEKISGHVPMGLNKEQFGKFTELTFDLVDTGELANNYRITCADLTQSDVVD